MAIPSSSVLEAQRIVVRTSGTRSAYTTNRACACGLQVISRPQSLKTAAYAAPNRSSASLHGCSLPAHVTDTAPALQSVGSLITRYANVVLCCADLSATVWQAAMLSSGSGRKRTSSSACALICIACSKPDTLAVRHAVRLELDNAALVCSLPYKFATVAMSALCQTCPVPNLQHDARVRHWCKRCTGCTHTHPGQLQAITYMAHELPHVRVPCGVCEAVCRRWPRPDAASSTAAAPLCSLPDSSDVHAQGRGAALKRQSKRSNIVCL